ncbi:MAG: hypothetical protein M3548_05545, partial [Actinomycetota bacterium]|nr:hypothetical protein [Actinomycetota bacterium]
STPEQVGWLIDEWPAGGPVLVVAGESAIGEVCAHTVRVGELDIKGMRAIWDAELNASESKLDWPRHLRERGRLDELLRACWGRPGTVRSLAREVGRRDSLVTVEGLVAALRSDGRVDGVLERLWATMLDKTKDGLSADAAWLLHGLAELPVTGLSSFAIAGVLAEHRGSVAAVNPKPLTELRVRNLVRETDDGYRMPSEIRAAVIQGDTDRVTYAREAVSALVRYAVRVTEEWLVTLRSGPRSKAAERWFQNAERSLWPLFNEQTYHDPRLLAMTIDDLARIADVLDEWYMREQQAKGLLTVSQSLADLANLANRDDLAALAAIRKAAAHRMMGNAGEAYSLLNTAADRRSLADPALRNDLELREHVERALLAIANSDTEAMTAARDDLTRIARRTKPPHRSRRIVEINLSVLHLRNDKPKRALRHARIAERFAADGGDKGCTAHAIELQGVALSQLDGPLAAVRSWERAYDLFLEIGDEQGEARCLQHLGPAALVDSEVAGLLRDGKRHPLDARACARVALPRLERAKQLRAGQPDTDLVDHYLAKAQASLASPRSAEAVKEIAT